MKRNKTLYLIIVAHEITVMLLTFWLIGAGVPFAMGMFGVASIGGILLIAEWFSYHSGAPLLWIGRNKKPWHRAVDLVFLALYVGAAGLTIELLFGDERFFLPISDYAVLGIFMVATIAWVAYLVKQAGYDWRKGRHAPGQGR